MGMDYDDILRQSKEFLEKNKKPVRRKKKRRKDVVRGGKDQRYQYVRDEQDNLVARQRYEKAKQLGRALHPHEAVFFKDGNRENFAPDNLVLGLKSGARIDSIICPHCDNDIFVEPTEKDIDIHFSD